MSFKNMSLDQRPSTMWPIYLFSSPIGPDIKSLSQLGSFQNMLFASLVQKSQRLNYFLTLFFLIIPIYSLLPASSELIPNPSSTQ